MQNQLNGRLQELEAEKKQWEQERKELAEEIARLRNEKETLEKTCHRYRERIFELLPPATPEQEEEWRQTLEQCERNPVTFDQILEDLKALGIK